ncbi:MAG: hypothetical protein J5I98_10320, partial [Phaeodactylibacter sp.]|nr:hypothetical protein [Phaeodactylibacter sp.]
MYTPEKNGLSGASISSIAEDEQGNLWLFSRNREQTNLTGIDIFDPKTEKALPFEAYVGGAAPFDIAQISLSKIEDVKKRLWIATKDGALFVYQRGAFQKIFEQKGVEFKCISIDEQGYIWIAWGQELRRINFSGEVLESMALPHRIFGVWAGENQAIWLATVKQERTDGKIYLWSKPENAKALKPFRLSGRGPALNIDGYSADRFFIHRSQKGLWYVDFNPEEPSERCLRVYDQKGAFISSFQGMLCNKRDIEILNYFDGRSYFWLATPLGLMKTGVEANPFHLIHRSEGFSSSRGITEGAPGDIYFINGHIYKWNSKNGEAPSALNKTKATHLLTHLDSILWAGQFGNDSTKVGLEVDLGTKETTNYSGPDGRVPYSILKDQTSGQYWVGLTQGLAVLDLKNKKLLPFHADKPGNQLDELLASAAVYHLHKNQQGIWAATSEGIFLMNETGEATRHFSPSTGDLPFGHIRHIYEDSRSQESPVFWLATKGGGVIRWEPRLAFGKSTYRQFTAEAGLSNNYTYAIYGDDYGKLWISSDKGLMRMDKATFQVQTYLVEDGLPHNEFNVTSHYQAKDGSLYFGGLGGVITFHPQTFAYELSSQIPLEFIGYYLLEGDGEQLTDKTPLLHEAEAITLQPSDKFLELHFSLLDYDDPQRHRYAYQIEGYSDNWNHIRENYLRITHLPYGSYTLKVKGQNINKGWSAEELVIQIRVLKPFYFQWWFIVMMMAGIAVAILATIQSRLKQLQKDRARLETEVQKRTRQIEEDKQTIAAQAEALQELDRAKTRFFSNITHEFRTPLTLIIGPLEQALAENPPPSIFRRRMQGVIKNARHILVLINQLLDLAKMESGRMVVEAVRGDIVAYTRELAMQFQPLAGKKGLRLHFISDPDCWETNFDRDKWDKLVYTLLSNAIKFTPQGNAIPWS